MEAWSVVMETQCHFWEHRAKDWRNLGPYLTHSPQICESFLWIYFLNLRHWTRLFFLLILPPQFLFFPVQGLYDILKKKIICLQNIPYQIINSRRAVSLVSPSSHSWNSTLQKATYLSETPNPKMPPVEKHHYFIMTKKEKCFQLIVKYHQLKNTLQCQKY